MFVLTGGSGARAWAETDAMAEGNGIRSAATFVGGPTNGAKAEAGTEARAVAGRLAADN